MREIRHGLIGLGSFYALAHDVNGWLVFLFILLLWGISEQNKKESEK